MLSDSSPDFIYVYDRDLCLSYVNSATASAFGRIPEDLIGATPHELFDPRTAAHMAASLGNVFDSGTPRHTEASWHGPWGEKWLATWLVPITDDEGTVTEVFGVSRDITDRKLAEGELAAVNAELERRVRQRTAELQAANEELEGFAYAVSHDLRTPLRAIAGFSRIVLDEHGQDLGDAGRADLDRVRAAAQRMEQLVDALLVLSRLSRKDLDISRVDLSRLAGQVVARLREQDPGRHVETSIAPGCVVSSDPALLEVVLGNLLDNAWKFTSGRDEGRIEFGVIDAEGERAWFVRDNGAGFDAAYAGKLFQPFQRLHPAREYPGTGIGLATVRRIVARLGGRCWAEGAVDEGATFYFTLERPTA